MVNNQFTYNFVQDEYYWFTLNFNKTTSNMQVLLKWDFGSGFVNTGNTYAKCPYNVDLSFVNSASTTPACATSPTGGSTSGDSASSTTVTVSTSIPDRVEAMGITIIVFTCVTVIFGFINQSLSMKPVWACFGLIYHIQFLLLLPMIRIVMHNDVISLFDYLNFYLFNFSFLPDVVRFTDSKDTDRDAIAQTNSYLFRLELKSGSAFYNMGELIFVLCVFIAVYIGVVLAFAIARLSSTQSAFYKFTKYIFDLFHFAI